METSWDRKSRDALSGFLYYCFLQVAYIALAILCLRVWTKFNRLRKDAPLTDPRLIERISEGCKATRSFLLRLSSTLPVVTLMAYVSLYAEPTLAAVLVALMLLYPTLANSLYMILFRAEMKKVTDL